MSYVIDVNVSTEQLAGIQVTLEEGLLGFVEATNKLRKASDEAKDGIDLTRELATIKAALGAMSGAIAEATTTEVTKIALAMTNIGSALSRVAHAIDGVDIGHGLQASVDSFVLRFTQSLEASLSHNHGAATPNTSAGKTQETINVQKIDITGRINDAILAKHFVMSKIDITDRVNAAITPDKFITKPIDLTERIQLAINAMHIGATRVQVTDVTTPTKSSPSKPPEGDRSDIRITSEDIVSRLRIDPIVITGAELVSQISIATVDIRDLVIDALEGNGGKVNLYDLIADEISAGLKGGAETKAGTAVNTVDAGLESIVKLFEDFRSSSETELLAARDQYAELEAVRKNISTINTKFISLGGSIAETIALFSSIGDSIKIVGAKFIELGNDVASGKTPPTEVADRGRSITDDEALNQSVKLSMLAESRKYHDQKNSPEFQDVDSRDTIIANRAYKLRERGAKLATTPNTSQENIDNLAKDLLHFGESISKLDEKIKGEAAQLLGLNESGKKALFATDIDATRAKLTKTAFAKNTGIGNVEGIVKSVNSQMSSPDYLNPRDYGGGDLEGSAGGNNIRELGRLKRNQGSDYLKELLSKAYQRASETSKNEDELIRNFESLVKLPEYHDKLSNSDKAIVADKLSTAKAARVKPEVDETTPKTAVDNLTNMVKAFIATSIHTIDEVSADIRAANDKVKAVVTDAKSKVDAVAAPVIKAAKTVKAAKQYFEEKKASLPIDVKAVAVDDDVVAPPSPPKQPVKPPTLKTNPVPPVPPKPPKPTPSPAPEPAPKEPGYPYYAGIVRNNWKASVKADLDRARAAISNELEQTDFVNLQRDQYLQLLKHRLSLAGSDDKTAATQAKAQLKTQLADLPNQSDLTQDRARSMVEKDDKRQRDLVTRDAKYDANKGSRVNLESIDPNEGGNKDFSRLKLVQSELGDRFTNIISQANTLAEIDTAFAKFVSDYRDRAVDLNLDKIDKIKSNRIAQIEKSIASAETKIKTDAKELYRTALSEYQEAIAGGFGGNLDEVRTAARGLEGKDRSNAMKSVYKAKTAADKLESNTISSGEKEDSQSFSNGYRLAKSQFGNKLPVSTANLNPTNDLQRSQLTGLNQKIGAATKTSSLANQPLSILEVMDESDKDVAKELDKRYNAIIKAYKQALTLAIAKASKKNETSLVVAPNVPDRYLAPVEPQLLSYHKSQTDAVDRLDKNRSVELRDEGTVEALVELEAGFALKLKGYASAMRQLRAELNKSNGSTKEVDLFGDEIKRLRAEVKVTGKVPDYAKLNESINFDAPQEILDRQFAQLAAVEIELREKVDQIANIKFNKKLQVARNNFKANGADSVSQGYREDANDLTSPFINDADDLQALAVTKTNKDKLKSFQAELDNSYNKIEEDTDKRRAKQVLQTLSESGHQEADKQLTYHEARYKTEGKTVPEELKAARAKVDQAFQDIIKADIKKVLADALLLNANTQIESGNFIKSQVPNYSQLTPKNKATADKEIESSIEKHNRDFQKSILDNLKLIIAESYQDFNPSDPTKRHHDSPAQFKAKVANYDELTPLNQIAAESQIASASNYFKTQTNQHDRYQFNEAKSQATNDGDLSGLQAVKDSVSTLAKEAGVLLDKMLADLMKMSVEEREHIANVRAQMNAARNNLTDEKPSLINAAILAAEHRVAPPTTLAPDGTQVKTANTPQYLHQLEYVANQGNKTLQADSKAAGGGGGSDEKKISIQDIAGYYYTLKSVASTVAETLHTLGEAAISTTRSMQLVEIANDNNKARIDEDIAASRKLSNSYGAAINDNLENLGKLKAGAPLEYDKQGEKLPSKVDDKVFHKLADALQAAGTVAHLDGQQQSGVNLAVQEILGKTRFQSKEVVRQLAQYIPGFVPLLASSQGMSTKELRAAMEQGNVGLAAIAPLANKLSEVYGGKAKQGTLIKEINTYSGQTKELGQSAALAVAPLAQGALSMLNLGLDALKANAGSLAIVTLPAVVAGLNKLVLALAKGFLDNPIAKEFFAGTGEMLKRSVAPIALVGGGVAVSAAGAKFMGENSLDTVMSKFVTSLSDAASAISKYFPSLPGTGDTFKGKDPNSSNTNYSGIIGGTLVAAGLIKGIRANSSLIPFAPSSGNIPNLGVKSGLSQVLRSVSSGVGAVGSLIPNNGANTSPTSLVSLGLGSLEGGGESILAKINAAGSSIVEGVKTAGGKLAGVGNVGLSSLAKNGVDGLRSIGTVGTSIVRSVVNTVQSVGVGAANLMSSTLAKINAFKPIGLAGVRNPIMGMAVIENNIAPSIKSLYDKIGNAVEMAKAAVANPRLAMSVLEHNNSPFIRPIGSKIGEIKDTISQPFVKLKEARDQLISITSSIGGRITSAMSSAVEKINAIKPLISAAIANPTMAMSVLEHNHAEAIGKIKAFGTSAAAGLSSALDKLNKAKDFGLAAIANPRMALAVFENNNAPAKKSIGASIQATTQPIGDIGNRVKDSLSSAFGKLSAVGASVAEGIGSRLGGVGNAIGSKISQFGSAIANLNTTGSKLAAFGLGRGTADNPLSESESQAKSNLRAGVGDLALSFVGTVATIAIANTTFVNDYTKVMDETITNLETAAAGIGGGLPGKSTLRTLNEREGTDKDGLDKFTNFIDDLIAASSGDLTKMTAQALTNASDKSEVGNKYAKEIERRQKDPNFRLEQEFKTNKSKANEDTVVKGGDALDSIRDLQKEANNDAKYADDIKDADKKKAKVSELKEARLKREDSGEVISIDDNERLNTIIENADKEYDDSVIRINNRRKQLITALKETVKLREIAIKSPGQLPTNTDVNLLIKSLDSKEKEIKNDIKRNQKDIADKYDPASILTRDSTLNEQSIRKLDLDNNKRVIADTQKSTASIKMRGKEGDELASGARKSKIDVDTATSDLALAKAKAELAKTYLDIVNSRPGTDDESNAKLKEAVDKNNEAIRKSTDTEKALEQAKQDQKNQIEQTLITKYDNDQNTLNTQFSRATNRLKTSAEVSLNTRRQPEVDADVAAKLDEASVIKARETYQGLAKIAKFITVNKTAFTQRLNQAYAEYQNSAENLSYSNKTRDRERQVRLESNNNQDFDRKFTRLENSASLARQDNTPQNVVFAEASYKRDIAGNNVSQTKIDAEAALNKVGEMARLISKIKSPELKLDKTIEYEKLVAEAKKRNYEVESAKIAELKTQYEQVKTIVDSLADFNSKMQANNIAALEKRRDVEIRDRVASSVSGIGETDSLAEARIKVEESRKFKQQSEGQLEQSVNNSGDIINAYGTNKLSTLAPTDTKGFNSLSDELKQLGKIANSIAPNLSTSMPEDVNRLLEVLTRSKQAAIESPSYEDGDKIAVSANLGKSKVIANEKLSVPAIDTLIAVVKSFQKPVETKYAASETLINSQNALNVAEKVSARELAEDKKKIADQKVEKLNYDSTRESKFVNELAEFDTQTKLANSKAPDAQLAINATQTLNELAEEIRQRSGGDSTNPTRLDVFNSESANRKRSFEDSIVNVSPEKNLKLANKYQINEAEKKKTYDGELIAATERINSALKTQINEFIKLGEVGHLAYKQLAESLMAIQTAGVNLLKTYGMMQGQVTAVSFSLGADNKYKASSTTYNADDVAQTASVKAGQEVDTQNNSIQEFKRSTAHLTDANGGTKINEVIALAKTSGDNHLIRLAEQAQIALMNGKKFDPAEINNFVKLLQAAGENLVAITDEQRRQVMTNAAIAARSEQNSKMYESNAAGGESYIKSRQSEYRHGTVESFGDVRDIEDKTTQMYRDKIAANREATVSTVIKNGGESSVEGQIALRQGQNKEREIQNEFADLPLYGKQFSTDIGEAVNSTLKISTIFRESIEKGLGTALIDTFRNFMNKLADTYSDRAAKQLGDMARGGIDNLFGLNTKPEGLDKTLNNTPFDQLKDSFTTLDMTTTSLQASFEGLAQAASSVGSDKAIKNDKSLENFFNTATTGNGGAGNISDTDMGFGATQLFDKFKQMPTEGKGGDGGGEHVVSGLLGKLLGGSGGGGAMGIFGSLLGFSEGSIPSLSMGSLPSYADGHMGSEYPQTKYQDPRESSQSHLAVINRDELVLSKAQTEGYMQYKQDMINNSINTNHNNNSTANHYNNTNVSFRDGDSFGNSDFAINKSNKTRFDRK